MKKFIAILLTAAICISLFGCASEEKPEVKPTEVAPEPTAEVTAAPTEVPGPTAEPTPLPTTDPNSLFGRLMSDSGYDMDLSVFECSHGPVDVLKISEITDEEAKKALIDAGHSESDYVVLVHEFPGDILSDFDDPDLYEVGYLYDFTIELYSANSKSGGYLIAMDSTAGNHAFASGVVKKGYSKKTYNWTVGPNGEYAISFYEFPADTYIAGVNLKLKSDAYYMKIFGESPSIKDITEDDLAKGYTYDFKKGNVPDVSDRYTYMDLSQIPDGVEKYADIKANLIPENGFGDYAFYSDNGTAGFYFLLGLLKENCRYDITMRIYTTITFNEGEQFSYLLPMQNMEPGEYETSGHQATEGYSDQVNFKAYPVEGKPGLYDVKGSMVITKNSPIDILMSYSNSNHPAYIASITVTETPVTPAE